jgi:uncharacterized GH25 family protein
MEALRSMKTRWVALAFLVAAPLRAHDMFLVVEDHDLPAGTEVAVALYNGTFDKSENAIDRDRMIDVTVIDGAGEVGHPTADQWRDGDDSSILSFSTQGAGTYVVGVSTRPRMIELSADDFNKYLEHDGVLDVLAARDSEGILDRPANERYSKHVKTILQVGGEATETYSTFLGYPIEIVPQANPAALRPGDTLRVLVMADGAPVVKQLVYASYDGYHSRDDSGGHQEAFNTRTDERGVAEIEISRSGRWYVRLIRMLPVDEQGVDYESNWATLTFEVP